jgi:hypothetical protein
MFKKKRIENKEKYEKEKRGEKEKKMRPQNKKEKNSFSSCEYVCRYYYSQVVMAMKDTKKLWLAVA